MKKEVLIAFTILIGLLLLASCGNRQPQSLKEHINLVIKEQSAELKQQEYDEIFSGKTKEDLAQCMLESAHHQNINENNELYKSLKNYKASDLDGENLTSLAYISMVLVGNFYSCAYGKDGYTGGGYENK